MHADDWNKTVHQMNRVMYIRSELSKHDFYEYKADRR